MKINKVVRRKGGSAVSALNAVITAKVGEPDQRSTVSSRQHVEIVQRDGHTEVRDHPVEDKE